MSNTSLTARYRPQTFFEVAGQDTLKTILSRASQEDKVAPAYLFSGTRGVGKTTLARIFAKALNCRNAPTGEPCNNCDLCHAVTMGNAVDVIEIDGASNRGIDDVRRLKEVVGYAPMDGRYKIFIIDEAHMLSREAFNALLKTLEEPPARVTFIMATTEPHKFPATIVSRCQHYVFKRLPEADLAAHLSGILRKEGVVFEENAIHLIARRGAGSVRDSMSLLGQVLALGGGDLTEEATRGVLGLAGQEALISMAEALAEGQTLPLTRELNGLLDQGLDIGFFLRELAGLWRNLFILRQSGKAGLAAVDVPEAQAALLLALSERFSLSHIHACWQMTLEGQRRVLTSLEPGLALELLLMNLAMLPQLLSLDGLSSMARRAGAVPPPKPGGTSGGSAASRGGQGGGPPPRSSGSQGFRERSAPSQESGGHDRSHAGPSVHPGNKLPEGSPSRGLSNPPSEALAREPGPSPLRQEDPPGQPVPSPLPDAPGAQEEEADKRHNRISSKTQVEPVHTGTPEALEPEPLEPAAGSSFESGEEEQILWETPSVEKTAASAATSPDGVNLPLAEAASSAEEASSASRAGEKGLADEKEKQAAARDFSMPPWADVIGWCAEHEAPTWFMPLVKNVTAVWQGERLILQPKDAFAGQRLMEAGARAVLDPALRALCGAVPAIEVLEPVNRAEDHNVVKEKVYAHPAVKALEDAFEARIIDFGQIR